MKGKEKISNSLLDRILKEARKTQYISIDDFLKGKGYDKSLSKMIRDKLIKDGNVVSVNDGYGDISITVNGLLLLKDGGYVRKRIKEYIPPTTALIGCITGTISFVWNVLAWLLG